MMFVYECLTLMVICLLGAFCIIPKIVDVVNNILASSFDVPVKLMKFGVTQMCGVSGVMIVIVILASVIPLRKLTRTKPIDTILDK